MEILYEGTGLMNSKYILVDRYDAGYETRVKYSRIAELRNEEIYLIHYSSKDNIENMTMDRRMYKSIDGNLGDGIYALKHSQENIEVLVDLACWREFGEDVWYVDCTDFIKKIDIVKFRYSGEHYIDTDIEEIVIKKDFIELTDFEILNCYDLHISKLEDNTN